LTLSPGQHFASFTVPLAITESSPPLAHIVLLTYYLSIVDYYSADAINFFIFFTFELS
jgi:hypothetical protein